MLQERFDYKISGYMFAQRTAFLARVFDNTVEDRVELLLLRSKLIDEPLNDPTAILVPGDTLCDLWTYRATR